MSLNQRACPSEDQNVLIIYEIKVPNYLTDKEFIYTGTQHLDNLDMKVTSLPDELLVQKICHFWSLAAQLRH